MLFLPVCIWTSSLESYVIASMHEDIVITEKLRMTSLIDVIDPRPSSSLEKTTSMVQA